jgi:hypothetical protein
MKELREPPEGVIITIGPKMYNDNAHGGFRNWRSNFIAAMEKSETDPSWVYYFRQGNKPTQDKFLQYVYLSIGGKIRFRCMFAGSRGAALMEFENHNAPMFGKAWILVAGPISTPDRPVYTIDLVGKKGFQGFRYCSKLF